MSQSRPTVNELLEAVRKFISDAASELSGQSRFNALSSAYVLAICERELRLGERHDASERERWSHILGDEADLASLRTKLCQRIRQGSFDQDEERLLKALLDTAVDEVRIVKPDHLAPEHRSDSHPIR